MRNHDDTRTEPSGAAIAHDADAAFMRRALALAERGRGRTAPNPMVGCVLVRDGAVVGEGHHARAGEAHAEAVALAAAGPQARGATAYVTLEPCTHHGRTPPCSEALLDAGVARVVVAARDPDPDVPGRGVERLREAGLEVTEGVLRAEAEAQNEAYRTAKLERRPFVVHKAAMSLDGKIATSRGESKWITGEAARSRGQHLRDELDAIAVGIGTVLHDDPRLTTRLPEGRTPHKVVFDSGARTPPDAALFAPDEAGVDARVTLFVGADAPAARVDALRARGATVVAAEGARPEVRAALDHLFRAGVTSLLVEGGGALAWAFLAAATVDRVAYFVAPTLLGGTGPGPLAGRGAARLADAPRVTGLRSEPVGADLLLTGSLQRAGAA